MTEQMDDEISLLDLLLVVAENWLLLVLVPLAVGAVTFGLLAMQDQPLRSQATLNISAAVVETFVTEAIEEGNTLMCLQQMGQGTW